MLAILCSGQGHQHPAMFALTAEAPEAADIFAAATQALDGRDPRQMVRDVDDAAIHTNGVSQILCCTQALAAFALLRPSLGSKLVLAGYSVGELASWGCAGLFSPQATLALAKTRAAVMDDASGPADGLGFVGGLDRKAVEALCRCHDAAIAIVNPNDVFVVGGAIENVAALCAAALAAGAARVGRLKVSVASHTPRLAAAAPRFRKALDAAAPTPRLAPGLRLFSGIDGSAVLSIPGGLDKLAAQICQTIDWAGCLDACVEVGVDTILELGPGNALATMAANAYPGINARALDDFRSLIGVEAWLAKAEA
ncbi:acyltransferase domain-containing protein [Beijerinckia sp. L45]|uniref:acyltransferase domain-containing protein n=1 Tax=Beijerinckia sp. L45 TaxID=1641855 RepID=UPI0034CDB1C0